MWRQWRAFQPHLQFVAKRLALDPKRSADRGYGLRRWRSPHAGALDVHSLTIDAAERDFRVANRLRDHELDAAIADQPQVAGLSVHRLAGLDRLRPLRVDEEWLAIVAEADFFLIANGFDARVPALALPAPGAQHNPDRRQRRLQLP